MPIRVMDELGNTSPKILKIAIDWAIKNNATIINLSLGGNVDDSEVTKSIKNAINKNIYVIAAAGDYHNPNLLFPADLPFVVSVMAQNTKGERYSRSNFSDKATISAPGNDIPVVSIASTNGLLTKKASGTSIAAANITGLAALVRSENNSITQDQFVTFMKSSIDDDKFINAYKLMTLIKSYRGRN